MIVAVSVCIAILCWIASFLLNDGVRKLKENAWPIRIILAIISIALLIAGFICYFYNIDNSRGPNHRGQYWSVIDNMTDPFSFLPGLLIDAGAIVLIIFIAFLKLVEPVSKRSKNSKKRMYKINGVFIHAMSNAKLIQHKWTSYISIPVYFLFSILFFIGVLIVFSMPESFSEMFFVTFMLFLGCGIWFVCMGVKGIINLLTIIKVLCSRDVTESDRNNAKSAFKAGAVKIAIIIIVGTLASYILALWFTDKNSSGSGCRNCGRDRKLVPGFGYCYDCYEGFSDWQDKNREEK